MDLDSTLIRAEALFKRFQRLVDAVDKKGNFPAPRARLPQSPPAAVMPGSASTPPPLPASPQGRRNTGKSPAQQQSPQEQKQPERVITPELRKLLSRQVEALPRKEVGKKDGSSARP